MRSRHCSVLGTLIIMMAGGGAASAQRVHYEPPLHQPCGWFEPQTKLDLVDGQRGHVIVRGSTHIMTLQARGGSIRVDAIELRDQTDQTTTSGVLLELRELKPEATNAADEVSTYIDYDEIDGLIKAWDAVAKADDTITKLADFEARFRTRGDLEIAVFRQTPGGAIAAAVTGGLCDRVKVLLSLDELSRLRYMILQARARLDEAK
jgi:hypothetical protein